MNSKKQKKNKYKDLSEEEVISSLPLPRGDTESFEEKTLRKQQEYRELTNDRRFGQKWKEYNQAQTKEKLIFYKLLDELLNVVPKRIYTFGRPRKSLRDMLFCCLVKIYSNTSSRRIISELKLAQEANYIQETPHFNTVLNYFDDSAMSIVLNYLIGVSALPLKNVEEKFAIDSTGFGANRFDRYFDSKYGEGTPLNKYRKVHAICGTYTQIITSVQITGGNVADTKMFEPLVKDTANLFNISAICADKGYSSRANMEIAKKLGAMPYIPFKKNVTGRSGGSPTWAKMYRMFTENYYQFAQEYHKRSNIESCFSAIKRKFGDFCRCRTERSQDNEILCKILCNNIVTLVHEIFNRKLNIDFFMEARKYEVAQKVI